MIKTLQHQLKKTFVIVFFLQFFCSTVYANPGDTTWVTIYNQRKLTYYGDYDTTTTLPSGVRYRKIRLHYILGTYVCPGNPQYCGSWDYTTQIFAKPANNDTVEIARVITPYATNWIQTNRKHDYVIDVTDYAPILQGNLGIKFAYQGYSFGFHVTVKLEMIEGIPAMDALKIKNIYNGYFPYGNDANPIENYLTNKTYSYASPATKAFVKNFVSGHGSDDTGCSEFCSKYYQLLINNTQISQKQLWRNDCGLNQVYPQTGTWLYDRSNWCPGAVVWPIYHDISAQTTANTDFSVNINMEPYSAPDQGNASGGYGIASQLISYSVVNHATDISVEEIIAPSNNENHFRNNSTCSNPIIKIKNVGNNTITQIVFNYGLQGMAPLTYTWNGSINFLSETNVVFPPSVSVFTNNLSSVFNVSVVSVNGNNGDDNLFNNIYSSVTNTVTTFPSAFVVKLYTNNATDPATGKNETSWKIYDENGVIVSQRNNLNNLTVYLDTINLQPGCYKLSIDDSGCDGYEWWAYSYYNPNPGTGTLRLDYTSFPASFYNFSGDIGCNYTKYFKVAAGAVSLKENNINKNLIDVFPNPAGNVVYFKIDLQKESNILYKICDITGKIILEEKLNNIISAYEKINVSHINNGIYFITFELENGEKQTKKIIIQN